MTSNPGSHLAPGWHLAQVNVGLLHQPLDHPDTAEFVDALDHVNALAESSPGFVWRLVDEETGRSSSYVHADDDPLSIINLSVWMTPDHLHDFVYRTAHTSYLRRRLEWFQKVDVVLACWWVPVGHRPSVDEAMARLDLIRRDGVTDDTFTLRDRRPAPGRLGVESPIS